MTKIAVFGGSGLVGSKFLQINSNRFDITAPDSSLVDITDFSQVLNFVRKIEVGVVINFAAFTNVDEAEKQKGDREDLAYKLNATGAKNVADACKTFGKYFIHISTEYVFDGTKSDSPYTEDDKPNPINWYGTTKYFGEEFVQNSGCIFTIVRLSMPYSGHYEQKTDIARFFLNQLKEKKRIQAVKDQNITPILTDDIAGALAAIIEKKSPGIYHVASKNYTTPFDFAKLIAKTFNLDASLTVPIQLEEYNQNKQAKLLKNSWLSPSKFEKEFGEGILHTVEENVKLIYININQNGKQ